MASARFHFGVVAAALTDQVRDAGRLARVAGFDGVLVEAYSPALDLPALSVTGRREFLRTLSSQDRQLVGLRVELGRKGLGPAADVDQALARVDRVLEAAKGLAAPRVCLDLGPLPAPPAAPRPKPNVTPQQAGLIIIPQTSAEPQERPTPSPPPDTAAMSQVDAALVELGRRADRYGVSVAMRSDLSSLAALERALRAADCPWFGVDLDPVAVLQDAWDQDEAFSRLGALVRHVRGRDAVRGSDRRTRPAVVGNGDTEWEDFLADLDAAGYAGWITLDPLELSDRADAASAGLRHLRSLSGAA